MRKSKKIPDVDTDLRPKINITGVARLMNLSVETVHRRITNDVFSLEGVPVVVSRQGKLYDMAGVFAKVFPSADSNKIADLMYDFMRENRGLVK